MKKLLPLLFFALIILACKDKATPDIENKTVDKQIKVEQSKLFQNYPPEKLIVADFIEFYFNTMYDSSLEKRNSYWNSSILTSIQDRFLQGGYEKEFFISYPPKLLGIRKLKKGHFLVKVALTENGFTAKIMNLKVALDPFGKPYFIDLLGENLERFNQIDAIPITYYYSPQVKRDHSLEKETMVFNEKVADFFGRPPSPVKVIVLKGLRDYCDVLGYEYSTVLSYDTQTGGIALPDESIIFSANGTPYYPHELVHLYTAFYTPHFWFDEGMATYLGGSVGFPLEHHLQKIANSMDSLDFSNLPENQTLDDDTNLKYGLGGLFCKLAMENYGGKESVMKLMNSGKEEVDFFAALKSVFNIKKEEMDSFIRKELEPYLTKE